MSNEPMDRNGISDASRTESLLNRDSDEGAKRGERSEVLPAPEERGSKLDVDELSRGSWGMCYRVHTVRIQSRKTRIYSPCFRPENALSRAYPR